MLVTFVIPAYNEEATIAKVVAEVKKLKGFSKQILVVDDGSRDRTAAIASKLSGVRLIRHPVNKGKGAALNTGFAAAKGDIVVVQDADMENPPKDYPSSIELIRNGKADAVFGSRFLGAKEGMSSLHAFGNWFLSIATTILFGQPVTDVMTGHKLFRREVVKSFKIESNRFEIEPEITVKVFRGGWHVLEVPITYHKRKTGQAKINVFDGLKCFLALLKFRFSK